MPIPDEARRARVFYEAPGTEHVSVVRDIRYKEGAGDDLLMDAVAFG